MRRRDDDGGLEESELGWMFEASPDDLQVPVQVPHRASRSQRKDRSRRSQPSRTSSRDKYQGYTWRNQFGIRAAVPGYEEDEISYVTVATWTSLVIVSCMFLHEVIAKSLSNGIALFILAIPPITVLYTAAQRWEHKRVEMGLVRELFFKGFGPGFLLLLFIEMLCAVTVLGYYCYGTDCTDTVDMIRDVHLLRDLRQLARLLYQTAPLRGLLVAFVLCFFTAGFLEESTKLFFVSSAIRFGLQPVRNVNSVDPISPVSGGDRSSALFAKIQGESQTIPELLGDVSGTQNDHARADFSGTGFRDAELATAVSSSSAYAQSASYYNGGLVDVASPIVDISSLEPEGKPNPEVTSMHGIILYFIAFSAGLATSESMLYIICLARTPSDAMRMALARICFSLPMHAACGCFTGLGLIERYLKSGLPMYKVLMPAVVLHGMYDFLLLLLRATPMLDFLSDKHIEQVKYGLSLVVLLCTLFVLRRRLSVFFHASHH